MRNKENNKVVYILVNKSTLVSEGKKITLYYPDFSTQDYFKGIAFPTTSISKAKRFYTLGDAKACASLQTKYTIKKLTEKEIFKLALSGK